MERGKISRTIIFTDGSSRGNPGPGGWGAVVVAGGKVEELGGGQKHTTNNQMEIKAAIEGLKKVIKLGTSGKQLVPSVIYTDSSYLINGITKWVQSWEKNDWKTKTKTEVLNKKLWQELLKASKGKNIEWKYIGGHRGVLGNERCDEIATSFADSLGEASGHERSPSRFLGTSRRALKLYKGPIEKYGIDILNIDLDNEKSEKRTKDRTRSKAKAYSYVSSVDGMVQIHSTWAECEARVKGAKGARYKKALSTEEEREIIKSFS